MASQSIYRPDIDGLRALAVLSVVTYHAFPTLLGGGFVGVDVFFVISGYLISSIIFHKLKDEKFSFLNFYARRIQRIFPALITVLVFSFVLGWFVLLDSEFKSLGKHIAGGAGFVSNFLLWEESGYFDALAKAKPLLHLWSLAVEEQFYIVFPVLLWLCWKVRINLGWTIALVALVSFTINIVVVPDDAVQAFYSPVSRFWELMVGALLAYLEYARPPCLDKRRSGFLAIVVPYIGMLMLLGSFILISDSDVFPGFLAVFPVVGTALLISGGDEHWLKKKLLASNVLIWIGLISYPLYLWHWPLLSIATIIEGREPDLVVRIFAVALSFILAGLTFLLIEKPIRSAAPGRIKIVLLLALMLGIGAAGLYSLYADGVPSRAAANPVLVKHGSTDNTKFHRYSEEKFYPCTPRHIREKALSWGGHLRCQQSKRDVPIDFVIIGDSHAEHLFVGLAEALATRNVAYYIRSGMPIEREKQFGDILKQVTSSSSIQDVLITAYWWKLGGVPIHDIVKLAERFEAAGKQVYITNDIPVFEFQSERCKFQRRFRDIDQCSEGVTPGYVRINKQIKKIVNKAPFVKFIDTNSYLCGRVSCSMNAGNKLLYRDSNHLNVGGSKYVARKIIKDFPGLVSK